jgi:serine phosphatase RsbU (regulator of sigma subunit)
MFYTDGVTEARRGEDEFGYDRLLEATVAVRQKHASEIKNEVLESVKTFTEHQANHDDLTLVVLKWCGTGSPAPNNVA